MITSPQRSIMVLRYRPYMMHPTWGVYKGQTPKVYNAIKHNFRPWRRWGAPPHILDPIHPGGSIWVETPLHRRQLRGFLLASGQYQEANA